MKLVALQVHALHLRIADRAACGIFSPVQSAGHFQSLGRGRCCDQIDDRFVVAQRFPTPI